MDTHLLAYLAGAMDSDGYFSIKRSTYHIRVRKDAHNPVYSEVMGLKQVTPIIPELLHGLFGGYLGQQKPQTANSKSLWAFRATDARASKAVAVLLPYLRIKRPQAELLLELRETKNAKYKKIGYWFEQQYPDWQSMELVTTQEALKMLPYSNDGSISQALRNGTLVGLPYNHTGINQPRFPKLLIEQIATKTKLSTDGRVRLLPPQLLEWKERLHEAVRELNKIGINGTPIYHRTGIYTPLG